jgi:uncharacterized protein YoxC
MLGVTTVGAITGLAIAISFALFMITATWVMLKLAKTLSITNNFLDDVRKQTIPLMTRFQTTMDHVNKELELVDGMVESGEKIFSRVNSMTRMVQEVVASPVVKILGVGAGIQKAMAPRDTGEGPEGVPDEGPEEKAGETLFVPPAAAEEEE